jgi:trimeric autotransporter adhesin
MRNTEKLVVGFAVLSASLWAQTFLGGIRGSVTDKSGAVIPEAKVSVTDQATGIARATVSNTEGGYSFAALTPATYTIVVEKPGFKKLEQRGLIVATQGFLNTDLQMEVGQVSESVNVTADADQVETSNASVGQDVDKRKLDDLPNMGRNPFYETVKISQNVTPGGDPKFNRMEDQSGSSQISIAGGPITGNNYLLDGIAITNSANQAVIVPIVEATQEVKVQINTYDAEVGRTGGGTFNLFLKSGSNDFHAAAFGYEWLGSSIANNFFANAAGLPEVPQMWKNFGGSFGGPVWIPKVYNGHNKTFFWLATEGYRQNQTESSAIAVPTALEKDGNFSQSKYTNGTQQLIYNPASTVENANGTYTRQLFPGNIIPATSFNPIGFNMASFFPTPNLATPYYGATNYASTPLQYDRAGQTTIKLDQEITKWLRASASYLHYGSREPSYATWINDIATPGDSLLVRFVDATQANATITPSPTWVIALRWGFNRYPNRTYQFTTGFNPQTLGFSPTYTASLPYLSFPAVSMSDLSSFGGGTQSYTSYYSRSFSGSASKYLGKHSIKFGGDYRAIHVSGTPTQSSGSFSFASSFTSANPNSTVLGTGASLASLLLGDPTSATLATAESLSQLVDYYGVFIQDDFRATSKLTLNFGVRYEYETGVHSPGNQLLVGFDPTAVNPIQTSVPGITTLGVPEYAGQNGFPTSVQNQNHDKFGPRVGFAYALNSKTSIRGGYGLFWNPFSFSLQSPIGYTQSTPYNLGLASVSNAGAIPTGNFSNPFPGGPYPIVGNQLGEEAGIGQAISVYDNKSRSTRVHQYSFDIQRELPASFVVAVGYSGSITHDLIQGTGSINIDQLPDSDLSLGTALKASVPNPFYGTPFALNGLSGATITRAQSLLPFPEYTSVTVTSPSLGHALYNSFYAKGQKRMGHGLNFLTTFVWSKNEDTSAAASNTYNGQSASYQDNYNVGAAWALATINTPDRWTNAINYDLPFGRNRKWLSANKGLDYAIGGWSMNFETTMQTGFPLQVTQTNNNSVIGTSLQLPNATGISSQTSGSLESRLNDYFNIAAFSQAPAYTYGNVSRTLPMRGPGQAYTNASMFKTFTFKEKYHAQFRAEAFNITNTPLFYGPASSISNPATFGHITTQGNYPRIIQLGVRFNF